MTALLITWKDTGCSHENIVRMAHEFAARGYLDEPWHIIADEPPHPGDRVWVFRQGSSGPNGIFARGRIVAPAASRAGGSASNEWTAPVRFDLFVDPTDKLFVTGEVTARILRTQLTEAASGCPLDDEQSAAFEAELHRDGDWDSSELSAVVGDYFAMLKKELAGEAYSTSEHRKALMACIDRSPGAIKCKRKEISGVLMTLGMPSIAGYKPFLNFREALAVIVESAVDRSLDWLAPKVVPQAELSDVHSVMVPAPKPAAKTAAKPAIRQLGRRYDAAAKDAANLSLGDAGEHFVLRFEVERLTSLGRADLASRVAWVSKEQGDGLGYDIESFDADGSRIFIEVKTTRGPIDTPFFITPNELEVASELQGSFRIYRVFSLSKEARLYQLSGPLEDKLKLEAASYRARVGCRSEQDGGKGVQ